jgi:hypothetical protein
VRAGSGGFLQVGSTLSGDAEVRAEIDE